MVSLQGCSQEVFKGHGDLWEVSEDWKLVHFLPIFKKSKEEDLGKYNLVNLTSVPWEGNIANLGKHFQTY